MRGSSAGRRCSAEQPASTLRLVVYTRSASADAPAVCAEAWTQRASRSPCSLRAGSPWHDGCLCLSVCQVCKEQGRNSGSQHGRGNHERKRSSLSSAVAKKVAKGVHVGQRQEHVKRAGTRMQAQSTAAANVRA